MRNAYPQTSPFRVSVAKVSETVTDCLPDGQTAAAGSGAVGTTAHHFRWQSEIRENGAGGSKDPLPFSLNTA
jgi:hypothetical protein